MKQIEKIERFAKLLEQEQIEDLRKNGFTYQEHNNHCKVEIIEGRKYTKVNVGDSGKYMVDKQGNIYGIKAYGQVHKGHQYGTLDTIEDWYWGEYTAVLK